MRAQRGQDRLVVCLPLHERRRDDGPVCCDALGSVTYRFAGGLQDLLVALDRVGGVGGLQLLDLVILEGDVCAGEGLGELLGLGGADDR